jgi:hypothetical protein
VSAPKKSHKGNDDRLPLRWGVILAVAVGAGVGIGVVGGPIAGVCVGIAITGLLSTTLGS